jgi:predicted dehydrogenase
MSEWQGGAAPLRAAILGAGYVGREHSTAYREIGATVVGVADVVEEAARALADPWGARAMTDYRALLDETRPDVVSVGLPNDLHLEATLEALERGMDVLCEKPLALDSGQARRMVEEAERRGRVLMTGYHHRFQEAILQTRALIQGGELGTLCSFRCLFAWHMRRPESWKFQPAAAGGGVLIDSGGHAIDLFRYLVGEVARVSTVMATLRPGSEVEDNAVALLESADGTPGVIEVSWTAEPALELVVEGMMGTVRVEFGLNPARALAYLRRGGETVQLNAESPNPYARELAHFRECVAGRATPLVDGREGLRTLLAVEAAYRAARERQVVTVAPHAI